MKIIKDPGYEPNLLARSLASKKTFQIAIIHPKHKTVEIFQREIPDSNDTQKINFDKRMIEEFGIQGVHMPNSRSYILAQLLAKRHLDNLPVIGYDLIPQNIKLLQNGYIDFLVGQCPQKQAIKKVSIFFEHLV